MRLIDIITSPWAIMPDKLFEISEIYSKHLKGEKIDIKAIEAKLGRPLENNYTGYEVVNGSAILDINGPIAKKMNLFHAVSGGSSTELLISDFKELINDQTVNQIILRIDSPGGTVDGTADLARVIFESRGKKPIIALADGLMASAAYWIGAAADEIYITNKTAIVGSIGVVATHTDRSKANENEGFKVTEITAGKYKRIPSDLGSLTDEGMKVMQDRVDYIYSVFVEDVAKFRNVSVDTVLNEMADGKLFIGQQAIDSGLVDGILALDELINAAANGDSQAKLNQNGEIFMNISKEYILENHPEIAKAFINDGVSSVDISKECELSAKNERERIQAVLSFSMPGHEKLINTLAFDGKTTGNEAAAEVLKAEKANRAFMQDRIASDAAEIPAVSATVDTAQGVKIDKDAPIDEQIKSKWDTSPAIRVEFDNDFESYSAFERANSKNLVKLLQKGAK